MKWVTFKNNGFDQSNCFKEGPMSDEEAKKLVEEKHTELIGYCFHKNNPQYKWIVKKGTAKAGGHPGWTCMVFKVQLPKANEIKLFTDDYAGSPQVLGSLNPGGGWARPGRGQGIGDAVQNLALISGIDPNDLDQGQIGDCWLISAFAALAEFPWSIQSLIQPGHLALDGKYTVKLYDYSKGEVVDVVVDDRIPRSPTGGPAFVGLSDDGEIWPCILEKAFSKLAGGYENTNGGSPDFALGVLAGTSNVIQFREDDKKPGQWFCVKPTYKSTNPQDSQLNTFEYGKWPDGDQTMYKDTMEVLKILDDFDKQDYLLCAGSHAGSDTEINRQGVVQGHAYTVIDVVMDAGGSGRHFFQCRNPWGTGEWKGNWSDDSYLWKAHPEVAKALDWEPADDGMFWIEAKDFFKNYSEINICMQNMGKNRKKVTSSQKAAVAEKTRSLGFEPVKSAPLKMPGQKTRAERKHEERESKKKGKARYVPEKPTNPNFNKPVTCQLGAEPPVPSPHSSVLPMDAFFKKFYGEPPVAPYSSKFKPDPKAVYEHSLIVRFPDSKSKKKVKAKAKAS